MSLLTLDVSSRSSNNCCHTKSNFMANDKQHKFTLRLTIKAIPFLLPLVLFFALLPVSAAAESFINIRSSGDPQITLQNIRKIERHLSGRRIIAFLPNIVLSAQVKTYKKGALERFRVRPVARGTVLISHIRKGFPVRAGRLHVAQNGDVTYAFLKNVNNTENKEAEGESKKEQGKILPSNISSQSIKKGITTSAKGKEANTNTNIKTKNNIDSLKDNTRFSWMKKDNESRSGVPVGAAMIGLIAVLVCVLLLVKSRQSKTIKGHKTTDSIDIVAVRSMGGKHRLTVVETCGERVLLVTNDKEVRLLAKLDSGVDLLTPVSLLATSKSIGQDAVAEKQLTASTSELGLKSIKNGVGTANFSQLLSSVTGDDVTDNTEQLSEKWEVNGEVSTTEYSLGNPIEEELYTRQIFTGRSDKSYTNPKLSLTPTIPTSPEVTSGNNEATLYGDDVAGLIQLRDRRRGAGSKKLIRNNTGISSVDVSAA